MVGWSSDYPDRTVVEHHMPGGSTGGRVLQYEGHGGGGLLEPGVFGDSGVQGGDPGVGQRFGHGPGA